MKKNKHISIYWLGDRITGNAVVPDGYTKRILPFKTEPY